MHSHQAPPGGYSNVSFGGEDTQSEKFGGHNFNPKTQSSGASTAQSTAPITAHTQAAPIVQKAAPVAVQQQQQQPQNAPAPVRGRGNSSGGGSSSITFG